MNNDTNGFTIINDYSPQQQAEDARELLAAVRLYYPDLSEDDVELFTKTIARLKELANV